MERLLRYVGCKDLNIATLMNYLGHIKTYCGPFGGSFNTGFQTAELGVDVRYVYNDAQPEIFNFWSCAKEDIFKLRTTINEAYDGMYSYSELDDQMHYLETEVKHKGKFEDAAATYIIHEGRRFIIRGEKEDLRKHWELGASTWFEYFGLLKNIEIFNLDYSEIIDKVDNDDTLLLLDPPYYVANVGSYYLCDGAAFYHRGLAEKLKTIKSKFILSYNNSVYISSLYKWCNQFASYKSMYKNELYITNFDIDRETMREVLKSGNSCLVKIEEA